MADDIEKQIADAEKAAAEADSLLKSLLKLYKMDGVIDEVEKKSLASTVAAVNKLKAQAAALRKTAGGETPGGDPAASTSEPSGKPFTDNSFFNAFKDSIEDWATDCQLKITNALAYMIKQETPAGLEVNDAKELVMLVIPESKVIGAADKIFPIVVKAFNSALPSQDLTVNDIHKSWTDGMDALKSADKKGWFESFITEWKSEQKIPADQPNDTTNSFNKACLDYAKTHFPAVNDVQKAFVIELVNNVEDGWDWDSEAGFVEVHYILTPEDKNAPYTFKTAHINDASDQLHQSLKTVFKGSSILELPLPIKVDVDSGTHGVGGIMEQIGLMGLSFERTSRTPNNTSWKLTKGNQDMLDRFLKKKLIEKLRVSDLK
jgi:hypothetical protein